MSDDENREIESLVALSDMTKQDYLISRALCRDIHVRPTIRVQKTMSAELCRIADELGRLSDASEVGLRLLELSQAIKELLAEMHDKDMAAAKGKENLKVSEVSDSAKREAGAREHRASDAGEEASKGAKGILQELRSA